MNPKILVVDDETDVVNLLTSNLRSTGFQVITAFDGATALTKVRDELPSLVILDLMLPGMPGLEVCKVLKNDIATRQVPVIILTAKTAEMDRIIGLELGAEDYITKPFSVRELILRVNRALLHGKDKQPSSTKVAIGGLSLDYLRREVLVNGQAVVLTATEFRLLALLMERPGQVQGRERLLSDVWGYDTIIDTRTVDTHVRRLREKLGPLASYIETVRGVGYRLSEHPIA